MDRAVTTLGDWWFGTEWNEVVVVGIEKSFFEAKLSVFNKNKGFEGKEVGVISTAYLTIYSITASEGSVYTIERIRDFILSGIVSEEDINWSDS